MSTKLTYKPDYDNCLVNLSNSILKKFGAKTTANTLALADEYLKGDYKNVVLLVLDAMGTSIIEKQLEKTGFFRSHFAGSFDSVYPPTTVAATTSILSGEYPDEHGWLGWDMYFPQLGKNVTVFNNNEQLSEKEGAVPTGEYPDGRKKWLEDSIKEPAPAAEENIAYKYIPYKNIIDKINDAGGKAYAAMPFLPPFPKTFEEILKQVSTLCNEDGKKFIYSYWNEPDGTMHRTGTKSPKTHSMICGLEKMVEETVNGLSDTLFLITADHGHMDSINHCILDYPEILNCLVRKPSIEPRTLNFFVKDEYKENFPEMIRKYFGDAFLLLTREEVLSENLFGKGNIRAGLEEMIGDYVALSVSDVSLFNTHIEAQEMPGGHAGLTPEEVIIPLIVIEKK